MIWGPLLGAAWDWLAKMGAPILAAFMVGQYIAGRNCEEGKLREKIAALEASADARDKALTKAEELRLESQKALTASLASRKEAVNDEIRINPTYAACRAVPYPKRLRVPPVPDASADSR